MQLCERFHDGQANPESSLATIERPICLCEEIEYAREHGRWNSNPGVFHANDHLFALVADSDIDRAVRGSELDRVTEHVAYHLLQARHVSVDVELALSAEHRNLQSFFRRDFCVRVRCLLQR